MDTLYLLAAVIGGTLLLGQFALSLFGAGHDVDHSDAAHGGGEADHGSSWYAGILSVRAVVAAIMLFGLCGMFAVSTGRDPGASFALAALGGLAGLILVAQLMRFLHGLAEEGNVLIEQSVGAPATVYLTIPGNRANPGKVHLLLQNRTVEYQAITAHAEPLPTGSRVTVVAVVNSDTVEVTPQLLEEANP